MAQEYTIKITGEDNFQLEKKISPLQLAKILSLIILPSLEATSKEERLYTPSDPSAQVTTNATIIPTLTAREFLNEKNPKTIAHKITTFLLYFQETQQDPVSVEDIKRMFEDVREPLPTHFTREFDIVSRNGWISKNSEGKYYITSAGETAVNSNFSQLNIRKSSHRRTNGGKKAQLVVRGEVENLNIEPTLDGISNYWKLNKGDKILWLLIAAKRQEIVSLNMKEISVLAHKIGDRIDPKSITALTGTHVKNGRLHIPIKNDVRVFDILIPGIEYLKPENVSENKAG